jgi:transcriptional regulator with XRE-family HTH domain
MINWGHTIKKYRQKLNITQEELAKRVSVTPTYVSAIEHNRKEPSASLINEISRAFGLPREILYWDAITLPRHFDMENMKKMRLAKSLVRSVYDQLSP